MIPPRLFAAALALLVATAPAAASAQRTGGDENPLGLALGFGTVVAPALATPVLLSGDPLPRPGLGHWRVGLGWQNAPDSVAAVSSAGGYFHDAWWVGLESRADSRIDGSTGLDANIDAAYYLLLRPIPAELPVWVELLAGGSLETGFGANRRPYFTGGPSGGLRAGFAVDLGLPRLVFEGEALYDGRWGDAFDGVRHQVDGAGRIAVMFDMEGDDDARHGEAGVLLEYRGEVTLTPEATLPDTHRVIFGAILAF